MQQHQTDSYFSPALSQLPPCFFHRAAGPTRNPVRSRLDERVPTLGPQLRAKRDDRNEASRRQLLEAKAAGPAAEQGGRQEKGRKEKFPGDGQGGCSVASPISGPPPPFCAARAARKVREMGDAKQGCSQGRLPSSLQPAWRGGVASQALAAPAAACSHSSPSLRPQGQPDLSCRWMSSRVCLMGGQAPQNPRGSLRWNAYTYGPELNIIHLLERSEDRGVGGAYPP